ncbi:MAG TPA: protein phosphatase CheZ [Syntrophobacteraceae bacterium]|nr:protein phosphatase CheZ [Syntrophobacteraceae bacterium]
MTMELHEEDWAELVQILETVEEHLGFLDGRPDDQERLDTCRRALKSFHTTAAMLGLGTLEKAGMGLEKALADQRTPLRQRPDDLYTVGSALNGIIEELKKAADGGEISAVRVEEILTALDGAQEPGETPPGQVREEEDRHPEGGSSARKPVGTIPGKPADAPAVDFSGLEQVVAHLGGHILYKSNGSNSPAFQLHFEAYPAVVEQLTALLSPIHPEGSLAPELSREDRRMEKILLIIKDFMKAFSEGNLKRAQEALLSLTDQDKHVALYNEIGTMARQLHSSLTGFTSTLDPALKEMVEDKLPDSGNRLEHILEITEKAANTTLDHVEAIQKRNERDLELVAQMQDMVRGLQAIGDRAERRLEEGSAMTEKLSASILQTRDDLTTILTAQDYHDLTGQVVMKILHLLKDLEMKLVNVIQAFGVPMEGRRKGPSDELYGPAHKKRTEALHSQDDVDALLADFGF